MSISTILAMGILMGTWRIEGAANAAATPSINELDRMAYRNALVDNSYDSSEISFNEFYLERKRIDGVTPDYSDEDYYKVVFNYLKED